ncbi:TetR family transcriptional regulator [Nocardioides marmoriginsengisoli]|uniref:TetR family transcriptional regulator n=1 Tax=Nocardioides marmoriginsengisoli TaxID=661483 RepID=UPI001618DF93|nr:TetR family transcriptional regulator [Nocardioides marmoriginsengisoli]
MARTAREKLLVAGERLIAERGLSVPTQEIVEAAGQRNRSAVQYHFGARDGLITAILERRLADLADRQVELLSAHETSGRPDTVVALLEILIRPMFEVPYAEGSTHYARFLEQVRRLPAVTEGLLSSERWPVVSIVAHRLSLALKELPRETRRRRMDALTTVMAGLIADLERAAQAEGRAIADDDATITETVAMIAGMLTAPVSEATGA